MSSPTAVGWPGIAPGRLRSAPQASSLIAVAPNAHASHALRHPLGTYLPVPSYSHMILGASSCRRGCGIAFDQTARAQDSLPEWSKGVDSSSTSASCVGSNPTAATGGEAFRDSATRGCPMPKK